MFCEGLNKPVILC